MAAKRRGPLDISELNIVEDFRIGNTRIRIADNFCRTQTPKDVKARLELIARITQPPLTAALMKEAQS